MVRCGNRVGQLLAVVKESSEPKTKAHVVEITVDIVRAIRLAWCVLDRTHRASRILLRFLPIRARRLRQESEAFLTKEPGGLEAVESLDVEAVHLLTRDGTARGEVRSTGRYVILVNAA